MKAIIGKKVGMSQIFDENGKVIPVTVIEAGPCTVVQKKTAEKEGYAAVQLGFEDVPERKLTKPEMGHLNKAGVAPKKYLREFDLDNAAELNIGDIVKADTFKEGDFVQEINSRELDPAGFGVFTTGRFEAGKASNVIPDSADMWGTIRTIDPEQKVSALIHQRMTEIAQGVATAYRCTAEVTFSDYCPCMVVDKPLAQNALTYMTELLGRGAMDMTLLTGGKPGGGSEDFAFVSHEVPTVSMFLSAGNAKEGYLYGQHHPKVRFDDSVLYEGSAAYTYMALRWLADHKE